MFSSTSSNRSRYSGPSAAAAGPNTPAHVTSSRGIGGSSSNGFPSYSGIFASGSIELEGLLRQLEERNAVTTQAAQQNFLQKLQDRMQTTMNDLLKVENARATRDVRQVSDKHRASKMAANKSKHAALSNEAREAIGALQQTCTGLDSSFQNFRNKTLQPMKDTIDQFEQLNSQSQKRTAPKALLAHTESIGQALKSFLGDLGEAKLRTQEDWKQFCLNGESLSRSFTNPIEHCATPAAAALDSIMDSSSSAGDEEEELSFSGEDMDTANSFAASAAQSSSAAVDFDVEGEAMQEDVYPDGLDDNHSQLNFGTSQEEVNTSPFALADDDENVSAVRIGRGRRSTASRGRSKKKNSGSGR